MKFIYRKMHSYPNTNDAKFILFSIFQKLSFTKGTVIAILTGFLSGVFLMGLSSHLPLRLAFLLIFVYTCTIIAIMIGKLKLMLLATIIFDIPFQLDVNFLYHEEWALLGALGGLNFSATTFCLAALYAIWIGKILLGLDSTPYYLFRMILAPTLYIISVCISMIVANKPLLSAFEIVLLSQFFFLFVYIVGNIRSKKELFTIIIIIIASLLIESIIMIILRKLGHSIEVAGLFARIDSNMRVGGTVGSPSNAAVFLQMTLVVGLSLLLTKLNSLSKLLSLIAFILGIIALIFTFTRGSWIAFFLSITIFLFIASIRRWISFYYFALVALITISLSIFFYDMIVYRFLADDLGSAHSRIPLMNLALKMISENPILGVGSNNFTVMIKEYTERGFGSAWLYVVHNKYLLVWSETGILGLGSFLWFLFSILYRGWQCSKLNDQILSRLALGFTMAVGGIMVHMMVDIFNSRSDLQLFWLFAGVVTAMYNLSDIEKSEDCGERCP